MRSKVRRKGTKTPRRAEALESLYLDFIKKFYEDQDHQTAEKLAVRLEKELDKSPDHAASIRGEEIRSLIAELRGELTDAIRSREAEIRRILELHAAAANTPDWTFVSQQYDFSDVSDRLDLLAMLYDQHGDSDRAVATLIESKRYCEAHRIPFDSQDLLDELEQSRSLS